MKKDPNIAAALSLIIPGAGFVYCGRLANGIIYAVWWFFWFGAFIYAVSTGSNYWLAVIVVGITWILGILDSMKMARKFNERIDTQSKSL
jgi:galactitol-specific phosphotransferase system IIC component